jgi:hypothetical protein
MTSTEKLRLHLPVERDFLLKFLHHDRAIVSDDQSFVSVQCSIQSSAAYGPSLPIW